MKPVFAQQANSRSAMQDDLRDVSVKFSSNRSGETDQYIFTMQIISGPSPTCEERSFPDPGRIKSMYHRKNSTEQRPQRGRTYCLFFWLVRLRRVPGKYNGNAGIVGCCPTRIRTWTGRTKICSATVTPWDSPNSACKSSTFLIICKVGYCQAACRRQV